ncbi:excalibur calcium-binding domain-containing protein [Cryptosporangium sp. NPDC051539]|uniref:excalibur calcium-binding domain-containing protein n=1 Tax=Cryptosporangium sp. NPDC051539 TaxID=3363962 RepID=UPI0037B1063E
MTFSPQAPSRRTGLRPAYWALIVSGGVLALVCGACGIAGVLGSGGADPAPSASVVAATEPPSAAATQPSSAAATTGSPSESPTSEPPAAATGAPLIGDQAPGTDVRADADDSEAGSTPGPAATTRRAVPSVPRTTAAVPKPKPKPKPRTSAPPAVYYQNCDAVRAAGADPIHRGDPGYRPALDRDGDGIGCE